MIELRSDNQRIKTDLLHSGNVEIVEKLDRFRRRCGELEDQVRIFKRENKKLKIQLDE